MSKLRAKEAYLKNIRVSADGTKVYSDIKEYNIYEKTTRGLKYKCFWLEKANVIPVHQLVAYCKFGDAIFPKNIQVRHQNGNSLDNSWGNILIGTALDNARDIPREVRVKLWSSRAKELAKSLRKFSSIEIKTIRYLECNTNLKRKNIAKIFDVSRQTIDRIVNNKLYREVI